MSNAFIGGNHSLLRVLFILVLFMAAFSGNAFAGDKIYINPHDDLQKWPIFVYGVGDIIQSVLISIRDVVDSSGFITLTLTMTMLGFLFLMFKSLEEIKPGVIVSFFVGIWVFSYFLNTAKVDVIIYDQYNHAGGGAQHLLVDDVPAIVGVPISFISSSVHSLQKMISDKLMMPDTTTPYSSFAVSSVGYNFLGSIIRDSTKIRITNPNIKASFDEYFAQCVLYAEYSGNLNPATLLTTDDILGAIKLTTKSRYVKFYDPNTGDVSLKTCADAYTQLESYFTRATVKKKMVEKNVPAINFSGLGIAPTSALASAYSVIGASGSGGNIAVQNALINSINGAYSHSAALTGSNELSLAINTEQAKTSQTTGWLTGAAVFSDMVVYLLGGLQALVFALMPIVITLAVLPGFGLKLVGSVIKIVLWLALWPLGLEIVNYLGVFAQAQQYSPYISGTNGVSIGTQLGLKESTAKLSMVFSLIATIVPMLLYSIINKGEMAMTEALSKGLGTDLGKAAGAAAAKGDVAYDVWNSNNVSSGSYNTAHQITGGSKGVTIDNAWGQGSFTDNKSSLFKQRDMNNPMDTPKFEAKSAISESGGDQRSVMTAKASSVIKQHVDSEAAQKLEQWGVGATNSSAFNKAQSLSDLASVASARASQASIKSGVNNKVYVGHKESKQWKQEAEAGFHKSYNLFRSLGAVSAGGRILGSKLIEGLKGVSSADKKLLSSFSGQDARVAAAALVTRSLMEGRLQALSSSNLSDEEKAKAAQQIVSDSVATGMQMAHSGDDKASSDEKKFKKSDDFLSDMKNFVTSDKFINGLGTAASVVGTALMFAPGLGTLFGAGLRGMGALSKAYLAARASSKFIKGFQSTEKASALARRLNKGARHRVEEKGKGSPKRHSPSRAKKFFRAAKAASGMALPDLRFKGGVGVGTSQGEEIGDGTDFNHGVENSDSSSEKAEGGTSTKDEKGLNNSLSRQVNWLLNNGYNESTLKSELNSFGLSLNKTDGKTYGVDYTKSKTVTYGQSINGRVFDNMVPAGAFDADAIRATVKEQIGQHDQQTDGASLTPEQREALRQGGQKAKRVDVNEVVLNDKEKAAYKAAATAKGPEEQKFMNNFNQNRRQVLSTLVKGSDGLVSAIKKVNQDRSAQNVASTVKGLPILKDLSSLIGGMAPRDYQAKSDAIVGELNQMTVFGAGKDNDLQRGKFAFMDDQNNPVFAVKDSSGSYFGTYNPELNSFEKTGMSVNESYAKGVKVIAKTDSGGREIVSPLGSLGGRAFYKNEDNDVMVGSQNGLSKVENGSDLIYSLLSDENGGSMRAISLGKYGGQNYYENDSGELMVQTNTGVSRVNNTSEELVVRSHLGLSGMNR